jgi:hypothetical protein
LRGRRTSATRCRPDHKRRQPSSFQLLGLDGLVLTPVGGWGRGPHCHGARAKVVAAAGAEVVTAADQTTSATCRRAPNSLALMASSSSPIGRQGRGPLRYGARIMVATAAGKSPGRIPQGQYPRASSVTLQAPSSLHL